MINTPEGSDPWLGDTRGQRQTPLLLHAGTADKGRGTPLCSSKEERSWIHGRDEQTLS
ncbi:hypothetical protein DESC_320004 [Desulfosarcina cetonica]|nr:hypothetical protein DESC_320004 [Desulfosarcina cetonica]